MVTTKPITISDIGRGICVSKNTVSLALRNDLQFPEVTKSKIQKKAESMGYKRNPVVAHLMAQLRSDRLTGPKASLALINANEDPQAFKRHPTILIPTYVNGCTRRAALLGYC